ncbi:MAG: hypothetical protein J6X72_04465 [Clostridia bacterium]|nr:hypothetical protein [Clostridia bacterium]
MKEKQPKVNGGLSRKISALFAGIALRRLAGALCHAGEASQRAGDEILYGLPGVFTVELEAPNAKVRLIKEANVFRVLKKAETSDVSLRIRLEDLAVLGDIVAGECTLQRALAEGRLTYAGKTAHLAALIRAGAEGDRALLPNEEYRELYGKKRED